MDAVTPEDFFADSPLGDAVCRRVQEMLGHALPGFAVRASTSQVVFRRRRDFAYLWRPGQYLRNPTAEVVLSIASPRRICSNRFKEVAHPSPTVWVHHLEIHSLEDLDQQVEAWLLGAAAA